MKLWEWVDKRKGKVSESKGDNQDFKPVKLEGPYPDELGSDPRGEYGYNKGVFYTSKGVKFGQARKTVIVVAAFRLQMGDGEPLIMPPSSKDICTHIGTGASDPRNATAAMFESVFLDKEKKTVFRSELAEVHLVARCLEKRLGADWLPSTTPPDSGVLISNVFLGAKLDLQGLLYVLSHSCHRWVSSHATWVLENIS